MSLFQNAWGRTLIQNEWFDGETEIANGVKRRLRGEFAENGPSKVIVYAYGPGGWRDRTVSVDREFPTRKAAETFAQNLGTEPEDTYVSPIR